MKQLLLGGAYSDIAQKHHASRFIFTPDHRGEWNRDDGEAEMANVAFACSSKIREQTVEMQGNEAHSQIMTQECILAGRITHLVIFRVPEFGTRASFQIVYGGQVPVICAVDGDIARKLVKYYCEGDIVVVTGIHEPRPSTAAANTRWLGRFRVRDIRTAEDVPLAA